jgi:hypothetical protein
MNMKELFLRLFKPDLTITQNVGRYLACQQYQQCSVYLHKCKKETPKLLKRNFNYLIGISQNPEKMHRYKFVNELYELCFKEKSKYYNEAFYKQCVEAEPNEMDKPVDAYITALQPYFKD